MLNKKKRRGLGELGILIYYGGGYKIGTNLLFDM